jgi:hypothetical protein
MTTAERFEVKATEAAKAGHAALAEVYRANAAAARAGVLGSLVDGVAKWNGWTMAEVEAAVAARSPFAWPADAQPGDVPGATNLYRR